MRSFARALVAVLTVVAVSQAASAQSPSPKSLYNNALVREQTLRRELNLAKAEPARSAVLRRVRSLVETYERLSRQFPSSGYMDNALWQGALLAADAFRAFGQAGDRTTALQMFSALGSRFPTSSLVRQSAPHVKRLNEARPAPPPAVSRVVNSTPISTPSAPAVPVTDLTAIRRDVLPDALRITLELGREVQFRVDRLDAPARVFIDFDNTRAVEGIKDATIPFPDDDVVKQVRIGRQADQRTRVVMDLAGTSRHSIYALYNPYRVVVDFERRPPVVQAVPPVPVAPAEPALVVAEVTPAPVADPLPPEEPAPAVVTESLTLPAPPAPTPPAPPTVNASGGFSLSRQLGLGVSRIVLDPGHGGHDPGAKTRGLTEADLSLDVALRLEKLLRQQDGFEVVLTRRVDTFVALEERTAIANRAGADLFLSIHANASANRAARGVETYFLNLAANPDAEEVAARENATSARSMRQLPDILRAIALNNKIQESRDFAGMIQASLAAQMQKTDSNVRNRGVKQGPFMVLFEATMPSVLAEISFITNQEDATLLKTEKHRQQIAEALYAGILRYQQSLKRVPAIAEQ